MRRSKKKAAMAALMQRLGGSFAKALEIRLEGAEEGEVFKWFLASFLYGARISETIATRTYRQFAHRRVLTPQAIQDTGWDGLVRILDDGGYVRYDFSTATRLLAVSADLIERYGGRLGNVHEAATDPRDLERRLQEIGKGIGPVTANIFLRELRGIWSKADPALSEPAVMAARHLGLIAPGQRTPQAILAALRDRWGKAGLPECGFMDFEAALVRLGIHYCRRARHAPCPMAAWCPMGAPGRGDLDRRG
jgi:endonuclease III